ncbi:MAG TPA: multicopper oxidase domain-containing protein, partial [Thermoleophilaceae bacterium]|nr:multicopper oxidase domain-containing protein [Thermoleophilaceae bacterium]
MKLGQGKLSRRRLLGGAAAAGAALPVLHELIPHQGLHGSDAAAAEHHVTGSAAHLGPGHAGAMGRVDPRTNGFDPQEILRDFDEGRLVGGVREWEIVAEEKEIEVAPGVRYAAWAYNERVPGPTLRAREGERLRIHFTNGSKHPHTIHFHGIHTSSQDGVPGVGAGDIAPGKSFTYEFDATPFGLHLYHCHSMPLAEHIAKGLYGAFIIDPKDGRPPADELVMVMNGFDTNFDRSNEVYAVNTVAFEYVHRPVRVRRGELVRIYLVNALEF